MGEDVALELCLAICHHEPICDSNGVLTYFRIGVQILLTGIKKKSMCTLAQVEQVCKATQKHGFESAVFQGDA